MALTMTASIGVNATGILVKSLSKLLVSRGLTCREREREKEKTNDNRSIDQSAEGKLITQTTIRDRELHHEESIRIDYLHHRLRTVVDQPSFHTLIRLMPTNRPRRNSLTLVESPVQCNLNGQSADERRRKKPIEPGVPQNVDVNLPSKMPSLHIPKLDDDKQRKLDVQQSRNELID